MADVDINKFRASVVRDGSKPASPGFVVSEGQDPVDPAGTGQNHLPVTIAAAATGLAITDSQVLGGAGTTLQYLRGDASLATFPALTGFVPYTGANQTVNLNTQQLQAGHTTLTTNGSTETLTIAHTSGSGVGVNITKAGNNEGLRVNKTSGSGNAATIIGTLEATTLVKTGGTSSQFLKADGSVDSSTYGTGTVTSVGLSSATSGVTIGSTPVTTSGTITLAIATASGSQNGLLSSTDWTTFNNKQNALTNPVTGTGVSGQVAYFTGTTAISSESNLFWDATNDRLGIGTNTFGEKLSVYGVSGGDSFGFFSGGLGTTLAGIKMGNTGNTYGSLYFDNGSNDVTLFQQFTLGSLRFGTNSIVKMILTQNGRLLIGNAPPTESTFALDVNGTGQLSGSVTALSFIKSAGTSSQFLKADGSVDSTTYVSTSRTITINGTSQDLSADRTYNVGTVTSVTATSGTGISISGSPITSSGTLTITNTAPDQVVSLTASTGISISGTYPNFTITNTSPASAGGITGSGASGRIPIFTGTNTIGNSNINGASSTIYNENPNAGQFAWSFQGSTTTGQSYGASVVAGTNSSDVGFKVMNSAATLNYFVVKGDGKVGIGTDSLTTGKLVVKSADSSSTGIVLERDINSDKLVNLFSETGDGKISIGSGATTKIFLNSAGASYFTGGNLGVGTSSVTTGKLVVKSGESSSSGIVLETGSNTNKLVNIFSETADGKMLIASGATTKIFFDSVGPSYFNGGNLLVGTATNGASKLRIVGLPTSSAGLSSGDVYILAGTLMIA